MGDEKKIEKVEESEVIEKPSQPDQLKAAVLRMQRQEFHSGPLPHPDILERYGKIVNGGAERIVKVFEKQV